MLNRTEIQDILQTSYIRDNWIKLIKSISAEPLLYKKPKDLDLKNDIVKNAFELGSFDTSDGMKIGLYEIEIADNILIERNRVGLRNLLRKQYKQVDGCFAVYYQGSKWRFSYISETREFENNQWIESKTEPKRYTYVLGKDETVRTAVDRFDSLFRSDRNIKDIKESFSVEKVTKEFYKEFKDIFGIADKLIKGITNEKHDYIMLLFNRLLFLKFLEKKGWLDYNKNYLRDLFAKYKANSNADNFYKNYLYYLFFHSLNNTAYTGKLIHAKNLNDLLGVVPFLNGGLFEMAKFESSAIEIKDTLFDGIFNFFARYNFTVTENTPIDIEVAVDPEMLGKVFENLINSQEEELEGKNRRKETGSYYTPREVVSFMSKQSLKYFLMNDKDVKESDVAIECFINKNDVALIKNPEIILDKLRNIRILDPACGSGAFLVQLLHELVRLRATLFNSIKKDISTDYLRKLEIIQNNIYGADIQNFACEISKLRFWLSLIVDFHTDFHSYDNFVTGIDDIPPLPNLTFKIRSGDSLIETIGGIAITKKLIADLNQIPRFKLLFDESKSKKQKYISSTGKEKTKLETEIYDLEDKIRSEICRIYNGDSSIVSNSIYWETDFPEVIMDNAGFDIVIGNPPYVRQEKIDKDYKNKLIKYYPIIGNGIADLYVYFFGLALNLSKKNGVIALITLNKYLKTKYGSNLREYLQTRCVPIIIDFFELPVFEASTDTAITIIINEKTELDTKYYPIKSLKNIDYSKILDNSFQNVKKLDSEWQFVDESNESILHKINNNSITLKEFTKDKIFRGITTGLNEAFVVDESTKKQIIKINKFSIKVLKKYFVPTSIHKWYTKWGNTWFINSHNGVKKKKIERINVVKDFPAIYDWLKKFRIRLEKRQDKGDHWTNLRNCAYIDEFNKPKLVYIHTAKNHQFYLDTEGSFINNSCYMIISDNKFLYAYLNSKLFHWFKKIKFVSYGDADGAGRAKLDYNKMITIPIKNIGEKEHKWFEKKIATILSIVNDTENFNVSRYENEMDIAIYKLNELTYDEVKIVDPGIESIICKNDYDNFKAD